MNVPNSVAALQETAAAVPAGERVRERLIEVHALLADEMDWVGRELVRSAARGMSPATEAATHLLQAGGKRIRPLSVLLSAACFGDVPREACELAVVAELIHLATLLHDDVIDDGDERRGRPTSRRIWGNAVSVLAGDLLLTHALERTSRAAPGEVLSELFVTLRRLVDGEVVQLRGRTRFDPNEATYFQIVRDKTASLFVWAARSGARVAGAPPDAIDALGDFGAHLGVAFQLVDDVLDYSGDRAKTGKALYVDLEEGKLTLPLIRTLAWAPGLSSELPAARAGDAAAMDRVVAAVHASGACDVVRGRAREETALALRALERVPPSRARDLLAAVAEDLTARLT